MNDPLTKLTPDTNSSHPGQSQVFDDQLFTYKLSLRPFVRWQHALTIGPAFITIYDFHARKYVYVSEELERVMGYQPDVLFRSGWSFWTRCMDPVELESYQIMYRRALQYLQSMPVQNHSNCSVNMDFRCRRADGQYLHLLQQSVEYAFDRKGNIVYSLEKFTDVSHRPPETTPMLSVYTSDTGESLVYVPESRSSQTKSIFTPSEMRILKLLHYGCSTQEIANSLSVSPNTVSTHRKNMLKKAGVSNSSKLLRFAKKQGTL